MVEAERRTIRQLVRKRENVDSVMGEMDSLLTDALTQWLDCFTGPELAESVYRQAFP